jgi:hypothetical protein
MTLLMPLLSETDPITSSEGALDPLGFYTIADALAVRLVPGVRERQTRPRWLTVIAAGLVVCSEFEPDRVAADEVSEPWQVYEWHIVEGLARTMAEDEGTLRMPGLRKAQAAIRDGVPISASRYLKTPSVFGLHGVYRLLARSLEIESHGRMGDFGVELIQVLSREQGLDGFHQAAAGEPSTSKYDTAIGLSRSPPPKKKPILAMNVIAVAIVAAIVPMRMSRL